MGCFTFVKVMMILFNLAILLSGGTLLGVGIWVTVDEKSFLNIFGTLSSSVLHVVHVSYLLIVIGAILLVVGLLGCCSAQKESRCLLMTFFSVVLIIFIAEIAAAVVILVYTDIAETLVKSVVSPLLEEKYGKDETLTNNWNETMKELKCCGLNNYTDFTDSPWYKEHNSTYPKPCCKDLEPCTAILAAQKNVTGCFKQVVQEIKIRGRLAGGVAAGIGALEVAAMALSMYLYCQLDQK